ncbi:LysR substrate-binding domain-containing protein [Burkholderia sp. FXe9]|nr:LysR substrate-binding domain-containing protein [Burkholderia sp. FXe9]
MLVRRGAALAHAAPARVSHRVSEHQAAADRARRARVDVAGGVRRGHLLRAPAGPAEYTARRLFDEEVFPVCAPDYLAGRTLDAADLAHETLLRLEDGQRQWMSWSEWFDQNDIDRQKAQPQDITINSYPQIVQMTILGQGVSLGWRYMIDACIEAGLLVRVTDASASNGGGYYVISPNDRAQNHAARLFTRWLFEQAERQTAP